MIPVAVAVVKRLDHGEASSIILRIPGMQAPNDIIVLTEDAATASLLASGLGTLSQVHALSSACPPQRLIVRVNDNGARTPDWRDTHMDSIAAHLERVKRQPESELKGLGKARWLPLWVTRFWNHGEIARPIYGVCSGGPTARRTH
jgi:hypothetical protein